MTIPIIPSPWGFLTQLGAAAGSAFKAKQEEQDRQDAQIMRTLQLVGQNMLSSDEAAAMLKGNPRAPKKIPMSPRENTEFWATAQPKTKETTLKLPFIDGLSQANAPITQSYTAQVTDQADAARIDAMKSIYAPTTTAAATVKRQAETGIATEQNRALRAGGASARAVAGVTSPDIAEGKEAIARSAVGTELKLTSIVNDLLNNPTIASDAGKQRLGILQSERDLAQARIQAWASLNAANTERLRWMQEINRTANAEVDRGQKEYDATLKQAGVEAGNQMILSGGAMPKNGMNSAGKVTNQKQNERYNQWVSTRDKIVSDLMQGKTRPQFQDALVPILQAQGKTLEEYQGLVDQLVTVGTSGTGGSSKAGVNVSGPSAQLQSMLRTLGEALASKQLTPEEVQYITGVTNIAPNTPNAATGDLDKLRKQFLQVKGTSTP